MKIVIGLLIIVLYFKNRNVIVVENEISENYLEINNYFIEYLEIGIW